LVWFSQTPNFFFKAGYSPSTGSADVTQAVMDKRAEMYIKSIIHYIHGKSQYGSVVYAYDVVNEHITNLGAGGWGRIYGASRNNVFVKNAFQFTHEELVKQGKRGSVKLFYNDYNTYENTDAIIALINYVNQGRSANQWYCDGVGMQMHLDVNYPSVNAVGNTIDKFKNAGFEIQITELDVTINFHRNSGHTLENQAKYYGDLFKMLVQKKKGGANITSVTLWGLHDGVSWRGERRRNGSNGGWANCMPLLFTDLNTPKAAFNEVINAAKS